MGSRGFTLLISIALFLLLGIFINNSFSSEVTVFGPRKYEVIGDKPNLYTAEFYGIEEWGKLKYIVEGDNKINDLVIKINGDVIDLDSVNKTYDRGEVIIPIPNKLKKEEEVNTISVELDCKHGSYLTVRVTQEDENIVKKTKILEKQSLKYLYYDPSDGTVYTFRKKTSQLDSLLVNDIILIGITDTPSGALRRIKSIDINGDKVTARTSQVTLEEVVKNADIDISKTLSLDDVESPPLIAMKQRVLFTSLNLQSKGSGSFSKEIEAVIYDIDGDRDTAHDQIKVTGNIEFNSDFVFKIKIRSFKLKELDFTQNIDEEARLTMIAGSTILNFDEKVEICEYRFKTIKFMVYLLPVYVQPILHVYVGAKGNTSAKLNASVRHKEEFTTHIEYSKGRWRHEENTYNSPSFRGTISTGNAQTKVNGYAGPQLELMIYGVVGPYAMVKGYLDLDHDTTSNLALQLHGGVKGDIGVKVDALSNILDGQFTITIKDKKRLFPPDKNNYNPVKDGTDSDSIKSTVEKERAR